MFDQLFAVSVSLIGQYGLAVLFVAFVLEGALIGKIVPTRALFVVAVLAAGIDPTSVLWIGAIAITGATVGQTILFVLTRMTDGRVSVDTTEQPIVGRAHRLLDSWGLYAVGFTNLLPVVRGTLTVPAALSDRSCFRFVATSTVGTTGYIIALVAVAAATDGAITAVF